MALLPLSSLNFRSSDDPLLSVVATLKVWFEVPFRKLVMDSIGLRCSEGSALDNVIGLLIAIEASRPDSVGLRDLAMGASSVDAPYMLIELGCCDNPKSFMSLR